MRAGYAINGRYQVIKTLGEGGMANVYLAHDLILDRDVAVKLLRLDLRDDSAAVRRFHREADSLIKLDDPHIVDIFDIGEDQGMQYIVMEYVKGMDLKRYIAQNAPLSYEKAVAIMNQILVAVREAHQHGIVHRDLKPQNILLDEAGNVKITDFGIAIAVAEETMTRTNTLMGSVHYISPEQARGSMITQQSDIYSLGIILFELLTGHVPYDGETAVSIALKHYRSQMPSLRKDDPDIPQALENVVLHATAKDRRERYQSVTEMQLDLETCLDPKRKDALPWRPKKIVEEETKVLPDLSEKLAKSDLELEKTLDLGKISQVTKKAKVKSFKRRYLIGIGCVLVIILLSYFYLIPKDVSVPALKGLSQKQALQLLEAKQLEIGKITYQYDKNYPKGQVTFTSPQKGTTVKQNTKIALTLSKGAPLVTFGDYRRRNYTDVSRRLRKQGVVVKKEERYSDSVAKGEIIAQSIAAKKKVALSETTVTFTVSKGQNLAGMTDLSDFSLKEVKAYARECGLELIVKKVKVTSSEEVDTVIAQDPPVGTFVQEGDVLEVTIGTKGATGSKYYKQEEE